MRFIKRTFSSGYISSLDPATTTVLARDTNQAAGIARFAIDFIEQRGMYKQSKIDDAVIDRVNLFHTDSVLCGLSALAMKTAAPTKSSPDGVRPSPAPIRLRAASAKATGSSARAAALAR